MPGRENFENELKAQIDRAQRQKRPHVEINAGELHRVAGDYPDPTKHRMPVCCEVMRSAMNASDEIVFQPDSGNGASLTIRYKLSV